jgi:hypothetical protein
MTPLTMRLTEFPLPTQMEEYERAAEELDAGLYQLPGLVALYRTGSIGAPGISDLDRVVVTSEHVSLPSFWRQLQPRTRYLAMHSPFAADYETFARHRLFSRLEPLELLGGSEVPLENVLRPGESDLLLGTEGLVVALLKVVKQTTVGRIKVRPMLCELNNLQRDLRLTRIDPDDAPAAWKIAHDVTQVRSDWWSLTRAERIDAVRTIQAHARDAINQALAAIALRVATDGAGSELALRGPWSNVTVKADAPPRRCRYSVIPRALAARSRKGAEARWRFGSYTVDVPRGIIGILDGSFGSPSFRHRRGSVLHRYRTFLRDAAPGYAALGHAWVFSA